MSQGPSYAEPACAPDVNARKQLVAAIRSECLVMVFSCLDRQWSKLSATYVGFDPALRGMFKNQACSISPSERSFWISRVLEGRERRPSRARTQRRERADFPESVERNVCRHSAVRPQIIE